MTTTCQACGQPSTEAFCLRPECLTYGSGAIAPGPSIVSPCATLGHDVRRMTCTGCPSVTPHTDHTYLYCPRCESTLVEARA